MVAEVTPGYPSQWAAITAVAQKLGIGTAETLRKWVRRAEVDDGRRPGVTSEEHAEMKRLKRENAELRRANEILKAGGCRTNSRRVTAIRWAAAGLVIEKIIGWPTTSCRPTATS
jgi:transposase-like protein